MWGIIATWRMAVEGISKASQVLAEGGDAGDAIEIAVREVEDFPYYKSVGYGGLPNEEMEVELDAAFMDGDTLDIGAVAAIKDYANPVSIARRLSKEKVNNLLVGEGAEKFAHKEGFERKNMLTDRAKIHYRNRVKEVQALEIKPYSGHDTVGMVCLDTHGKMTSATSTSGLFMKKAGRVGDSPISGSGFYVDSKVGGASATGLGEDVMKGCVAYEIVRLMKDGIGEGFTRADHQDIANQLFACYAHVQDVRSLTSVIGEDELSDMDKKYISFGRLFEEYFINQGFDTNRSIEETLDLGWDLVSVLPREALDRLDNALLDQYYNHEKAVERFNIKEKKIIKELQEEGE